MLFRLIVASSTIAETLYAPRVIVNRESAEIAKENTIVFNVSESFILFVSKDDEAAYYNSQADNLEIFHGLFVLFLFRKFHVELFKEWEVIWHTFEEVV